MMLQTEQEVRQSVGTMADDTKETVSEAIDFRRTKRASSRSYLDLWDELEKEQGDGTK